MKKEQVNDQWKKFKDVGLLWFINGILHLFGWAIIYELKNGNIVNVYPKRVKYRGFSEKDNTNGYIQVSKYLKDNINELLEESNN